MIQGKRNCSGSSVLVAMLFVSLLVAPLSMKVVQSNLPYQDSFQAETIADGVLWHPVFDLNCHGAPDCSTPPVENGQSIGANFMVLAQSISDHEFKVVFIELVSMPLAIPDSYFTQPLLTPPRFHPIV